MRLVPMTVVLLLAPGCVINQTLFDERMEELKVGAFGVFHTFTPDESLGQPEDLGMDNGRWGVLAELDSWVEYELDTCNDDGTNPPPMWAEPLEGALGDDLMLFADGEIQLERRGDHYAGVIAHELMTPNEEFDFGPSDVGHDWGEWEQEWVLRIPETPVQIEPEVGETLAADELVFEWDVEDDRESVEIAVATVDPMGTTHFVTCRNVENDGYFEMPLEDFDVFPQNPGVGITTYLGIREITQSPLPSGRTNRIEAVHFYMGSVQLD